MERKPYIAGIAAVCAVLCAAVLALIADGAVALGVFACWLVCCFFIWIGEAAGRALTKNAKNIYGESIGAGIVCAVLLILVIIEVYRDLSLPKSAEDQIINLWGLGSFLVIMVIGPPVFAAIILNITSVIGSKRRTAKADAPTI